MPLHKKRHAGTTKWTFGLWWRRNSYPSSAFNLSSGLIGQNKWKHLRGAAGPFDAVCVRGHLSGINSPAPFIETGVLVARRSLAWQRAPAYACTHTLTLAHIHTHYLTFSKTMRVGQTRQIEEEKEMALFASWSHFCTIKHTFIFYF